MQVKIYAQVTERDPTGKIVHKGRTRRMNSYVLAFVDLLFSGMSNTTSNFKDTGNTARDFVYGTGNPRVDLLGINAASGDSTAGVVVGTGTNSVTISDYALQTQIAHGTGSGQLSHGSVSIGVPATVGSSRKFTIARTFTNNSGSDITFYEVGMYVTPKDSGNATRKVCIERSLLTATVSNGNSATVTYTISVSV